MCGHMVLSIFNYFFKSTALGFVIIRSVGCGTGDDEGLPLFLGGVRMDEDLPTAIRVFPKHSLNSKKSIISFFASHDVGHIFYIPTNY